MKSAYEIRCGRQRESATALVKAALGDEALSVMCSFANLDCIIDVKLQEGWIRYELVEGGEGENDDSIRRIG